MNKYIERRESEISTAMHRRDAFNLSSNKVELLILHGANINSLNKDGKTPLDLAMKDGSKEVIDLLKKHVRGECEAGIGGIG